MDIVGLSSYFSFHADLNKFFSNVLASFKRSYGLRSVFIFFSG
jgi:hypothetical protein